MATKPAAKVEAQAKAEDLDAKAKEWDDDAALDAKAKKAVKEAGEKMTDTVSRRNTAIDASYSGSSQRIGRCRLSQSTPSTIGTKSAMNIVG